MRIFETDLQKKTLKKFAIAGLSAAVAIVSGCSSDDPDEGTPQSSVSLSGVAIDGYLAGATVYLDLNDNGRRNAGEPSAVTDKDGFFTTSQDGLINYCATDATTAQKRHCLKAVGTGSEVVLRSYGGFDVFTGEPFDGQLSARVSADDFELDGTLLDQKISPLTSMLTDSSEADKTLILAAYGLNASNLDQDFLSADGYDADITRAAISFHKVVTIFANLLDENYSEFGEDFGFPQNTNGLIYKALADQIKNLGDLKDLSADDLSTALTVAYAAIQTDIQALYDADEDLNYTPVDGSTAIANAVKIIGLVASAIPFDTDFSEAQSRVIGVEMVVQKMAENESTAQIDAAITEAENTASDLYTALDATTAVDFAALVDVDYTALTPTSFDDLDISGALPLTQLAGKQLFVEYDENEDPDPTNLYSGSAHFFFDANEAGTAGTLNACLAYDDGDDQNVDVEETDGTLIEGTWFAIDDNRLVLTLEGSFDITLISKGTVGDQTKYSLSYGGDTVSWLSDDGLLDELVDAGIVEQPTDNAGCVALLNPQEA